MLFCSSRIIPANKNHMSLFLGLGARVSMVITSPWPIFPSLPPFQQQTICQLMTIVQGAAASQASRVTLTYFVLHFLRMLIGVAS